MTTIHNPLLAAAAVQRESPDASASSLIAAVDAIAISEPPPPPPSPASPPERPSAEAPTQPRPARVPFPIIDDPTLTMHHDSNGAPDPDGEGDKKRDD